MQLELSAEDREVLEKILERAFSEMRVEVRRTTTPAYHDQLKEEEQRVQELLERVRTLGS